MATHKVWLTLPDGSTQQAGELAFGPPKPDGTGPSGFRYSDAWLHTGFALDPESLPLRAGIFSASHLGPPLGVFDDALPDDWGRHLIDLEQQLPISQRLPERYLTATAWRGMGALGFGKATKPQTVVEDDISLADLVSAAHAVERHQISPDHSAAMRRLFATGTSPGGARPKVLLTVDGKRWLAKFPSVTRDGTLDVPALEFVAMTLARHAGLLAPGVRLENVGSAHVLLVERFDCTAQGRIHQISFKSLCRERAGQYVNSYDPLFQIITRHASNPRGDGERLFRQMLFNAALGNTDDHLKNFMMQGGHSADGGYRLSPAYDLVPDIARKLEHTLAIGHSRYARADGILTVAAQHLRDPALVGAMARDITQTLAQFPEHLQATGADMHPHQQLLNDIAARCAEINKLVT